MSRNGRRLLLVTGLAIAVLAVFSIYGDIDKMGSRLAQFAPGAVVAALALALGNYVIRFVRWQLYLRTVGVSAQAAPTGTSFLVFVGGFAMSVTPGKVGELLKSALLRDACGVPAARTAPIVVAERLTDLVALVVLGVAGVAAYGVAAPVVAAAAIVVLLGLFVVSWKPLAHTVIDQAARWKPIGKIAPRLREMYDTLSSLVAPGALLWGTALGVVAWLCECLGFALIVRGFPGAGVSLGLATLIYAVTTVAGALSFLPGGLGVTEASMTLLLVKSATGVDQPTAVAATILTRLCTLWFAVVLGLVAIAVLRRRGKVPAAGEKSDV
jgi:glycosyltransferase 2 family protein